MNYIYLMSLQDISDAIENVIEFFETIIQFIENFFKSLIVAFGYFIGMIPKITTIIATLPSWLLPFATITLGVSIAYFIIGRNTGKSD